MDDDSEQSPAATKPISIPGLHWSADGQATLSGPLLRRFEELESLFRGLGEKWNAQEVRFPPLISVGELQRIQYFRSFPHLFTAAVALDGMRDNLEEFTSANSSGAGELRLTRTAAVREILTPAACYHLYVLHQGQRFDRVRYFTTGAVCFRREESYKPLQRQWSFRMREIVCFGTLQEVRAFLEQSRRDIERIASALSIGLGWQQATDPFFDPMRNASFLMQKVDPVKMEMVFRDELAIGSMNLHRQHFGTAFQIERDGEPVHSACVAFGMERWLFALLQIFGTRYELWPLPLPVNS